ncbi:MAG: hypothetical protein D6718_02935 [Acidobacteria bacterium]|nr:MAG: hypothetical protein D6718_02935 [Acidobacteriota bacterium]
MLRRKVPACLLAALLIATGPVAARGRGDALVLVELAPGTTRARLERELRARSARLVAILPEAGVALARGGGRSVSRLLRSGAAVRVLTRAAPETLAAAAPAPKKLALDAWSSFLAGDSGGGAVPGGLEKDALIPPDWWDVEPTVEALALAPSSGASRPFGAGWENTSEYLAGSVSLNLILMESDGSVDPSSEDWSPSQESQVVAAAYAAAADLQQMYPHAGLSFTIHVFPGRTDPRARTSYEPISRPADPSGTGGEELWVTEILERFGYATGSRLTRSRRFADATRLADGTDWAVNVFVANSENDGDGRFGDGYFAYSWVGGPHVVMTTDNDGWGIARMDMVLRHELHHSFYALDEYAASACDCLAASGYLAGTNDNCENLCGTVTACVMRDNAALSCPATVKQVGLLDSDGDGTPDVLSSPPEISLRLDSADPSCDGLARFSGTAQVVPYPNSNPLNATPRRDISILRIAAVEMRVDGGPWTESGVTAADGAFDGPVEEFSRTLSLGAGRHSVEARARDDRGNVSLPASRSVEVVGEAAPVGATLTVSLEGGTARLRWAPAAGAASYRIYRAASPRALAGAVPVAETAVPDWADASTGNAFYEVTSVDACGRESAGQK